MLSEIYYMEHVQSERSNNDYSYDRRTFMIY